MLATHINLSTCSIYLYIPHHTLHKHGNDVYQIPDFLRRSHPNDVPHVEISANTASAVATMHIPSLVEKTFAEAALQIKSGTATVPDVSVVSSEMTEITPSIVSTVPTMAVAPIRKALKAPNKRQSIMMQTQPENWFGDY